MSGSVAYELSCVVVSYCRYCLEQTTVRHWTQLALEQSFSFQKLLASASPTVCKHRGVADRSERVACSTFLCDHPKFGNALADA